MNTYVSWGIILAAIGAYGWYQGWFQHVLKKPNGQQRGRSLSRANAATSKAPFQWSDDETKPKPAAKNTKAKGPRKSVKTVVKEVGNKVEASLSAASGAAADGDLSPIASVTNGAKAPSGRDVSDMLEPQAAKSVLKISASEKPARPAKPQQQRTDSTAETKKQRQNKKKNEEAKAAREAAEEERKKLAEQQRRTAREARGEAARNGLQAAKAPASNAWNRTSAPAVQAVPASGQLLDTIDNVSTTSSSATNGTAPTPDSTSYSNLPSEEDQVRMAMADSAWTEVPKGRKKAKNQAANEGSDPGAQQEFAPAPAVKAAPVKPTPAKKVEYVKPAPSFEALSVPKVSDPRDSDWPVM